MDWNERSTEGKKRNGTSLSIYRWKGKEKKKEIFRALLKEPESRYTCYAICIMCTHHTLVHTLIYLYCVCATHSESESEKESERANVVRALRLKNAWQISEGVRN